eukprot:symbB.v1.2.021925.t1/scaffold1877.1/size97417/1
MWFRDRQSMSDVRTSGATSTLIQDTQSKRSVFTTDYHLYFTRRQSIGRVVLTKRPGIGPEFMKIPGCQQGQCTNVAKDKKFLGGADLRAENAPKRLDDEIPTDPRKKLDKLREGLVSIGVGPDDFDRAWGRLDVLIASLLDLVIRWDTFCTSKL